MQALSRRIFALQPKTQLLPGHGEPTTVGREYQSFHNFLNKGWAAGACGEVRWDTQPLPPGHMPVQS
jgi:hypothetical protein